MKIPDHVRFVKTDNFQIQISDIEKCSSAEYLNAYTTRKGNLVIHTNLFLYKFMFHIFSGVILNVLLFVSNMWIASDVFT